MESFEDHLDDVTLTERAAKYYERMGFFARIFYYWCMLSVVSIILPGEANMAKALVGIGIVVVSDIAISRLLKPHYETYKVKEDKALEAWAGHYMKLMQNMRDAAEKLQEVQQQQDTEE